MKFAIGIGRGKLMPRAGLVGHIFSGRLRQASVVSLLCLSLAGCGLPLYLHKDAYEKETSEIKESVDKLDVESAYTALTKDALDLARAEDQMALAAMVSTRNYHLASLTDPGPTALSGVSDNSAATVRLADLVNKDLCALLGSQDNADPCVPLQNFDVVKMRDELDREFRNLEAATRNVAATARRLSIAYREMAQDKDGKKYLASGKTWLNCTDQPKPLKAVAGETIETPTSTDKVDWLTLIGKNNGFLRRQCMAELVAQHDVLMRIAGLANIELKEITVILDPAADEIKVVSPCTKQSDQIAAELFCILDPADLAITVASTCTEQSDQTGGVIKVSAAELFCAIGRQKLARDEGARVGKEIDEQLQDESTADPIAKMRALLAKIDQAGALAQVAGYDRLLELMQCGLIADLRAALPAADEKDGETKQPGTGVAAAGATTEPTTTKETPSVEDTAKGGLACVAGKSDFDISDKGNALVVSVVKLLVGVQNDKKALDRLERIVGGVLAAIQLRHKRDLANSQATFQARNAVLLRAKMHALLSHAADSSIALDENKKIKNSARGFAAMRKGDAKRPMAFALNAYAQSWDRGKIPVEIINYRLLQSRRAYDVEIAGLKAKNYRDLIKPLTDALAAYGAGGITPELIGQIIGYAAIGAGIAH